MSPYSGVTTAGDGPDALGFSRGYAGEIHLLFSDIELPGMSGIELGRQTIAERPGTQVLLHSANAAYRQLTEFSFLAKPFTPQELRIAVAKAVEGTPPEHPDRIAKIAGGI